MSDWREIYEASPSTRYETQAYYERVAQLLAALRERCDGATAADLAVDLGWLTHEVTRKLVGLRCIGLVTYEAGPPGWWTATAVRGGAA